MISESERCSSWHIPPLDGDNEDDGITEEQNFMGLMLQLFDNWGYTPEEIHVVTETINGTETAVFESDQGWQFLLPKPLLPWQLEFFELMKPEIQAKKMAMEILDSLSCVAL